ncbi:hypothetical protein BKA62DRAFT_721933 [Auriculariales sp. MPI-PUGE-AT-0066]|nr:hypothetical protein BKA62DRAFT_721933 [Auriculariales sp. MPI-PUGE-AT-0066]
MTSTMARTMDADNPSISPRPRLYHRSNTTGSLSRRTARADTDKNESLTGLVHEGHWSDTSHVKRPARKSTAEQIRDATSGISGGELGGPDMAQNATGDGEQEPENDENEAEFLNSDEAPPLRDRYPLPNPEFFTSFEKKYPPDIFGEEAGLNARVWRVYRDRVTELDEDLLDGWHKTLDVLLIFIGLYSAVATAFIIESSRRLQPDYSEITAKAVIALLAQANASIVPPTLPSLTNANATTQALWINGLWFASLTIALVDALLTILAKQWLVDFASKQRQPAASARNWAWRHYAYRQGIDRWHIGLFISTLSVLLYLALYLFLFGLLVSLFDLDPRMCAAPVGLTGAFALFHIASMTAPLWWGDCPTTTPLLSYLRLIGHAIRWILIYSQNAILGYASRLRQPFQKDRAVHHEKLDTAASYLEFRAAAYDGTQLTEGKAPLRDSQILSWMIHNLLTDEEVGVAVDAIGALDHRARNSFSWTSPDPLANLHVGEVVEQRFQVLVRSNSTTARDQNLLHMRQAAVLRTLLYVDWPLPDEFRDDVRALFNAQTYDIDILADMVWDRSWFGSPALRYLHLTTMQNLGRYCIKERTGPRQKIHGLTRTILVIDAAEAARLDTETYLLNDPLAVCGLVDIVSQEPPNSQYFDRVLIMVQAWLRKTVELRGSRQLQQQLKGLLATAAAQRSLDASLAWGTVIAQKDAGDLFPQDLEACKFVFGVALARVPIPSKENPWVLEHVRSALACFSCDTAGGTVQLSGPVAVVAATRILIAALQYSEGVQLSWSPALDGSVNGVLLRLCDIQPAGTSVTDSIRGILRALEPKSTQESHIADHVNTRRKILSHDLPGAFLKDTAASVLKRRHLRTSGLTSIWEVALSQCSLNGDVASVARMFAVELSILSHPAFADLIGADDKLEDILDALAGGDRGVWLALADTAHFSTLAIHGRVVSTEWWEVIRQRLLSLPAELWNQRIYQYQHATPHDLVREIDSAAPCQACKEVISEVEEQRGAHARTTYLSASPTDFRGAEFGAEEGRPEPLLEDRFSLPRRSRWTLPTTIVRALIRFKLRPEREHDIEMRRENDGQENVST